MHLKARYIATTVLVVLALLAIPIATAQTFDNSGGGSWTEYMSFPLTSPITEYAQYKIVINGTTWVIYNVTGSLEASGTNNNFWSLVNSSGADIRVFNQNKEQRYFWIEEFDYSNQKAVIWVKVETEDTELNIAYGNPSATESIYENPAGVFEVFEGFENNYIVNYNSTYETTLKPAPVPASSIEVVYPDGVETIVVIHRDGTTAHGSDYSSYATVKMSRDGGQTWTTVGTIDEPDGDDSRSGNCLIKVSETELYFFNHVDYSDGTRKTVIYKLTWNGSGFDITRYDEITDKRIFPQFVEDGVIKVGIWANASGGLSAWEVYFGEYDPATKTLTQKGLIKSGEAPNENSIVKLSDGTLVGIVRLEGDNPPTTRKLGWAVSYDNGDTWTWKGYIPNTEKSGSPLGKAVINTPIGEKIVLLHYDTDYHTSLGIFNPTTGKFDKKFVIDTVTGDETGNGGLRLVESTDTSFKFYIVHEQGSEGSTEAGNGIVFRISTITYDIATDGSQLNGLSNAFGSWSADSAYVIKSEIPKHGSKHLYCNDQSSSGLPATYTLNNPINYNVAITFYGRHEGTSGTAIWFTLRNSGTSIGYVELDEDSPNINLNGQAFSTYEALKYHKITIFLDFSTQTITAEVNGDTASASFQNAVNQFNEIYIGTGGDTTGQIWLDSIYVVKLADPADFGTPLVKLFQKKFGTKTVYVNVTYLDTSVTERYNPTAYYKLEDKPQINVTSMLSVSGVNATYGANISIELIDFVTLDKVVYNGTEVSVTYQGTVTNSTTGYVYNVYSFTTYENGTLEIYGHVGNKAYEATFKLDGETVDVFNVTAVVGEALEITLPHKGNVTLASIEHTGVTSVLINTKDVGVGAKTLTITIDDPENFAVGYRYGTVNIDWGKIYFNITDLQNKTLARTTYGFFNKNFSILSTDPTKLYAGDIEIDVYFHEVKLKSLEIHLNHSNNGLTLNVSVNATQFKDYRNVTRIIASPNYFEVVNLSTKYPFSVTKLVNVSGTIVIDFVSNAPTSVKVEGATSYTYEKPVLKITASGNVTVTDLYKLSTPLKDRLGNPVNFYVLINGSRVDASAGKASKLLKPSWYEVEVPITVSGFELWKFNDSSNIVLVEINTSDKTLPTAEYRVPSKIETKEVRIQKKQFPWLPFPFSENKPAQEETPIVRLEGTLRDFYNAPIANRTIKIEVASPNFTRIYNVTTDSSGNFKIDVDMAEGVEYKVTYKFAGDDVYVATSTTKTFTIEQLLPAPPEEMTITELLIFVGIAIGLVAVVAGAIYLAKRTKAKTLARMESEFRFFRRLK